MFDTTSPDASLAFAWRRLRRLAASAGLAAALAVGGLVAGAKPAAAATCQPPSYCAQRGACLSIGQVRDEVRRQLPSGWRVARVRLRGHAPTATCLWYEVRLKGPGGESRAVYWNIKGGRAR